MKNMDYLLEFAAELVAATDRYFDVKLALETADDAAQEERLSVDFDEAQEEVESAANKLRSALLVHKATGS